MNRTDWGMIIVLAVLVACLLVSKSAYADNGITFGKSTYNQAGARLIVNSLGDQVAESTHGNLGYNDYIPENAFKNNLHEQGYTQVWDSKPDREDVVAVSYMGLKGDPRTEDVDYVLTKEYNRLNAAQQADRIDSNAATIMTNAFNNSWVNMNQSSNIAENGSKIADNSKKIKENSDRLDALEDRNKFKTSLTLEARLYDTKSYTLKSFVKVDTNKESEIGIILILKFGQSHEERMLRLEDA